MVSLGGGSSARPITRLELASHGCGKLYAEERGAPMAPWTLGYRGVRILRFTRRIPSLIVPWALSFSPVVRTLYGILRYLHLPQRRQQRGVRGVAERPSSVVTISAAYLRANSAGYQNLLRLKSLGCVTSASRVSGAVSGTLAVGLTALSTYLTNRWLRSAEGAQQGSSPLG